MTALIASLLLLFIPWTYDPFIRPKMLAVSLCVLWWAKSRRNESVWKTSIDGWAGVFFVFYLISLVFSLDKPSSLFGEALMPIHGLLQVFLYWQCFQMALEDSNRDNIPEIVLAFALPMCAYAFMQKMGVDFHHIYKIPEGRSVSTQGSPVYLASMLILIFPLCFEVPAIAPILLLGAWSAGTRSVWLGMGVAFLYIWRRQRPWLAGGAVLTALVGVLWLAHRPASFLSDMERIKTWQIAYRSWLIHPWFGWGPDNLQEAFRFVRKQDFNDLLHNNQILQGQAHNLILQSLVTIGGIGTGALLVLLISLFEAIPFGPIKAGLLGLLVQSSIEPIPFPTMTLAAVLAGSAIRPNGFKAKLKSLPFLAVITALVCWLIFLADGLFQYGQYREVILRINPLDVYGYAVLSDPFRLETAARYNVILYEQHSRWATLHAVGIGWLQTKLHPNDPLSHQLYADFSLLAGDLETAKREIQIASNLDPVFPIIQERKKAILNIQ